MTPTIDRNLIQDFPLLYSEGFTHTSPEDMGYNCIAWAAEDSERFWWPDPNGQSYWPQNVPVENTISAFIAAFNSLGYEECDGPDLEVGLVKVALYSLNGMPTHAARQLPCGGWTSKLGRNIDITHTLRGLEGPLYGAVDRFMCKPI